MTSTVRALVLALFERRVLGADTLDTEGTLMLVEDLEEMEREGWTFTPPADEAVTESAAP